MACLLHWTVNVTLDIQPPEGKTDEAWLETAVTLSLVRLGPDTRAARLVHELSKTTLLDGIPDDQLPDYLVEQLGTPATERATRLAEARALARQALAAGTRLGIEPLTSRDPRYPELLRHLADPPIILWARGELTALARPAVAVVGSRAATPTALSIAHRLGRELAEAGLVVTSGMARGVDGAAHQGALDARAPTIAVLGCGADVVYPREHAQLAEKIALSGVILSELPPGTPPRPGHFPLRNRIISGMSRAVVVVEASDRSGSLITAKTALDQDRDVLAVPGNVLSGRSRGCHRLIRDGAPIVESAADVLEHLRWKRPFPPTVSAATKSLHLNGLEETMKRGEPYSVEDLAAKTGQPAAMLLADLGTLELSGRIVRTPGGQYVRLD